MTYNETLSETKKIFMERLEMVIPVDAYLSSPELSRQNYLDTIYTDVMALGYNFNDKKKAIEDIYETQSALHGESNALLNQIKGRIDEAANLYQEEIKVFSQFHRKTQNGEGFEKVIEYIKSKFEIN